MNFFKLQSRLPEIAAVLLALVIAATVWLATQYRQGTTLVQHTLEIQKNLSDLLLLVQEMESGTRGFVITGDEVYLQTYKEAQPKIAGNLNNLGFLIADNPEQQRLVTELTPLIDERLSALKKNIEIRRTKGLESAVNSIRSNVGYDAMTKVRAKVLALEGNENELLRIRAANVEWLIWITSIATGIGVLLVILSITAWTWSLRRDAGLIAASLEEQKQTSAQLQQMQKIEAIGQLTGGIAHDFNNMLAVIISGLGLIKRRMAAGNMDVNDLMEATIDGANRAAALTSRLMAFARQQSLEPQVINANELIAGMAEMINRAIGETIVMETRLAQNLWLTRADPAQLESSILNLCINARDAMPGGGRIAIETENGSIDDRYAGQHGIKAGDYVVVAVTDTGSGMPADVAEKAFNPFFTTKPTGKGTGLGLSQVYGFVKQSEGHVRIYSELGHGTTIKIHLPKLADMAEKSRQETSVKPAPDIRSKNAGEVILVVEDDSRVRELTVSMVRELQYTVIHAGDANSALDKLRQHPEIALMFTDIVMPETNGKVLADKALLKRPELKILFTSGFAGNLLSETGVLDRDVHFIAKPFTLEQLAAKLDALLKSAD